MHRIHRTANTPVLLLSADHERRHVSTRDVSKSYNRLCHARIHHRLTISPDVFRHRRPLVALVAEGSRTVQLTRGVPGASVHKCMRMRGRSIRTPCTYTLRLLDTLGANHPHCHTVEVMVMIMSYLTRGRGGSHFRRCWGLHGQRSRGLSQNKGARIFASGSRVVRRRGHRRSRCRPHPGRHLCVCRSQ